MTDPLLSLIKDVTIPGAILGTAYIMKPIWSAIASKITGNGGDIFKRVTKIETNDLKHVEHDMNQLWTGLNNLQKLYSELAQRLSKIEGKLGI